MQAERFFPSIPNEPSPSYTRMNALTSCPLGERIAGRRQATPCAWPTANMPQALPQAKQRVLSPVAPRSGQQS